MEQVSCLDIITVVTNEKGAVDIDGAFAWVGKYGTKRLEI